MADASTQAHPVYCDADEEHPLCVEFSSDNVCLDCSAHYYVMEKRFQVREQVRKAGGRVPHFYPLHPENVHNWQQWRNDRDRFRSIGVDGGEDGELGQGWQQQKVVVEANDFSAEDGLTWKINKISGDKKFGWKEDLGFDGFLGEMGKLETASEPKGLTLDQVLNGVRSENWDLNDGTSNNTTSKEDFEGEPQGDLRDI